MRSMHIILKRTNLDILKIVIHCVAFRNIIPLVKAEIWSKHIFTEPDLSKCVQQPLIVVVGDSASVLNLSYHVADSGPGDALRTWTESLWRTDYLVHPGFPHQATAVYLWSPKSFIHSSSVMLKVQEENDKDKPWGLLKAPALDLKSTPLVHSYAFIF